MKIFSFSLAPMATSCSSSDIEPIKEQGNSSNGINLVSEENSSSPSISTITDSITNDESNEKKNDNDSHFDESSSSNLGFEELPHMNIRKKAAATYLARTTRQQAAHRIRMESLQEKCAVGEYVGLRVDKVDRTNTDPKILPCVVIERKEEQAKLACVFGILNQWWSLDVLIGISAVPKELLEIKIDDMSEISMISASKLYVRGAVNGVCCSCKSGCRNKQCSCRRNGIFCSTKCHKILSCCQNLEE